MVLIAVYAMCTALCYSHIRNQFNTTTVGHIDPEKVTLAFDQPKIVNIVTAISFGPNVPTSTNAGQPKYGGRMNPVLMIILSLLRAADLYFTCKKSKTESLLVLDKKRKI